jgi:3-hydroxyisobutyrate dehydrogenase-like beta-hydroxyacid dehydrogenase
VITAYAPRMLVVGERQRLAGVAKLIANFLQVSAMDLMGQSLALAERSDLPPDLAPQLLAGFFGNPGTREYIAKIGQRDFDDVGFTAAGGLKDVTLMIAAADEAGLRLSSAEAVRAKLEAAVGRGWRDRDWSCFTEFDRS